MSTPALFVIGATHHRAPLEVREKLALGSAGADEMRAQLSAMSDLR